MSKNIITYNLNSEVVTVNGVYLNKEQSIEITKIIEEKDQRIAELEKANKTAVKEFAEKLCMKLPTIMTPAFYESAITKEMKAENILSLIEVGELITNLLKERGIE